MIYNCVSSLLQHVICSLIGVRFWLFWGNPKKNEKILVQNVAARLPCYASHRGRWGIMDLWGIMNLIGFLAFIRKKNKFQHK